MNWHHLLLTAFISFMYNFVSASETDDKTLTLKAIVHNLPSACKNLNAIGRFNALTEKSYNCLFEDAKFEIKNVSIIMVLLMQRGNDKLVQAIAKKWVSERKWGPFNQDEIAAELTAVLSVKTSVRTGERKNKMEIELKSVYETFKALLESGNELIAANELYSRVAAKAFNLAFKVDKGEKDYAATAAVILDHFYSVNEKKSAAVDNVKMAQAGFAVSSLNHLAAKKKIDAEAWEVYGPSVCARLNSIFGTDFAMVERVATENASKNQESSSESSDSSFESEEENSSGVVTEGKEAAKPIKFIVLRTKSCNKVVVMTPESSNNTIQISDGVWFIIGGSALLLLISSFVVYHFVSKRSKKISESSDL